MLLESNGFRDFSSAEKTKQLVYESPLSNVVSRLRTVSLTTGAVGSIGLPVVLAVKGGDVPSAGFLGLAMAFVTGTLGSTAAIHFVFSPYVYSIERIPIRQCHYEKEEEIEETESLLETSEPKEFLLKAKSRGLFLNEIETVFDPCQDVARYQGLRPLCNVTVKKSVNLYVHPEFLYDAEMRRQMNLDAKPDQRPKENPDDEFI